MLLTLQEEWFTSRILNKDDKGKARIHVRCLLAMPDGETVAVDERWSDAGMNITQDIQGLKEVRISSGHIRMLPHPWSRFYRFHFD